MKIKSLILVLVYFFSLNIFAQTGVILLHGKWGTTKSGSPIGKLANALNGKGFVVVTPEMSWSRNRYYDSTYEESMSEINTHVQSLKARGVDKIVVGGHSMGANAAIGYGSQYGDIDGVLAIAPGHVPDVEFFQNKINNDWERAKKIISQGTGDKKGKFKDLNQGKKKNIQTTAKIYLSWFDPNGPAVIPNNVNSLKSPLLWVIGEKDIMNKRGEKYAFSKAPYFSKNQYSIVKGGHGATPVKGKKVIIQWLKDL